MKNKFNSEKKISNTKYMKYKSVQLYYNSKRPKGAWKNDPSCLVDLELYTYYQLNKSRPGLPKNYSLLTGKKNNLTIIDIDCNKDENIEDNIFIKKFGLDVQKWADDHGGVVVSTPSGGFHIYYQYEESIIHGQDEVSHVDTRNDGGLILAPGCIRDGKLYEIIAGDINNMNKMPEDIISFIHSIPAYDPSKKGQKKNVIKNKVLKDKKTGKTINVEYVLGCDQSLYEYNFPDELLHNIIKGLPSEYFHSYNGYLLFTTAMKQIDRQDIWEEYPKLNNPRGGSVDCEEHKCWMIDCWDGITGHKTMFAINNLLLNTSYNNARTCLDYFKLKPILKNKIQSDEKINSRKLGYTFFQDNISDEKRFIVVKSDTGTGKTTSFKSFMKYIQEEGLKNYINSGRRFISIVSRISLGLEQYETFNEAGIDCGYYENDQYDPDENYVIQIDSLMKLNYWCDIGATDGCVLFLDEFNSIIKHLITSETLAKNGVRIPIMDLLINLIRDAKYVIMTDADISDPAMMFVQFALDHDTRYGYNLKDKLVFIENEYKHNNGKKAEEIFSIDELIKMMKKEKKWICPCDEARSCDMLKEQIGDPNILVITSKTNKRYNWDEYDRIIFSPKVIYGLDSVMERPVFCFYQETTIDPRDMLQQINRNRSITKLYYLFQRKKCRDTDFNTFQDCVDDTDNLKKWCDKNNYLHQEISRVHPIFKEIFNILKYNKDCYNSNPYAHFKELLTIRGFVDDTKIGQSSVKKTKQLLKEDKERLINSINKDMEFVIKMNEYIGLPEDEIENFKEIFMDRTFIGNLISLRRFIFDKHGQTYDPEEKKWIDDYENEIDRFNNQKDHMKDKIMESNEFNIKKIKSNQSKMIFIDRLREELNMTDRLKINGFTQLSEEKANEYYEEYKAIYTDRSKKNENPLLTEEGTQKFIGMLYKKTFGVNPFNAQSTSKNGKTIRKYEDAELEGFNEYYEVYKLSKNEYVKKKDMIHQGKMDSEKLVGFLIDDE